MFTYIKYHLTIFLFLSATLSCTKKDQESEVVIQYKETQITREDYIKRFLKQGFMTFGSDLVAQLQNKNQLKRVQDKTIQTILESMFINEIANQKQIIIKEDELNKWIVQRTQGINETDLNYFLKYSNMSMKEWKSLFKDQLLKVKVMAHFKSEFDDQKADSQDKKRESGEKIKKLKVQTLSFDSTLEAQNIYKELKTFPDRFESLLKLRKGTTLSDWISEEDKILYSEAKNLRISQISKPFDSPWGHLIVKLLAVDQSPKTDKTTENTQTRRWDSLYAKKLKNFKESKDLLIDSSSLYNLKIKK